ncbi:MAG: hypothetical protein U0X91_30665 [Spirosomataceae bacterium]
MQTNKRQRQIYALFDDWGSLVAAFSSVKKAYDYVNAPDNRKPMKTPVTYQYFARKIKKEGFYRFEVRGFGLSISNNRVQSVIFF